MTAPDISPAAIAALLDGVTPGPWVTDEESEGHGWGVSWRIVQSGNWLNDIAEMVNEQDARFIAAARELVPALSAERDRLAAQVVQLQRDLDAAKVRAERAVKVKPTTKPASCPHWRNPMTDPITIIGALVICVGALVIVRSVK